MLHGKKIGLLVSGSIASYKAAELLREYVKAGADVSVSMTTAAQQFIAPLTFQTLSGKPVYFDLWSLTQESEIGHISFADRHDVIVVAPATANLLAKMAHGIADDAPSTILLATKSPIVVAPAMNVNMYEHPSTQANLSLLRARGVNFVEPGVGDLACGWVGSGRLAELSEIVAASERAIAPKDLSGSRVIVTAGPTQESYDPVRYISNRSTGKMGVAIAREAWLRGAEVTLITGPSSLRCPEAVRRVSVTTGREMHDALFSTLDGLSKSASGKPDYIFKASAVTDFAPDSPATAKIKVDKSKPLTLQLQPTADILRALCERRSEIETRRGVSLRIVAFAAETAEGSELIDVAHAKLLRKGADMIVANTVREAMGTDSNQVWIIDQKRNVKHLETADKATIASGIVDAAIGL